MAPRKGKPPGKRNNVKIKSAISSQKRLLKFVKNSDSGDKTITSLKWMSKKSANKSDRKSDDESVWAKPDENQKPDLQTSETIVSEYEEYPQQDLEVKSSGTDGSEECNCSHSKSDDGNRTKILKSKSSTNSLVSKYIKSGMNQVASFIVESAIRFGEQHGVVVPDKDTPNLYQFTLPDREKTKKIWLKFPDVNKTIWKGLTEKNTDTSIETTTVKDQANNDSSSWRSTTDSLEDIPPILERLKEEGETVTSDLDLEKLRRLKMEADERENTGDQEWASVAERQGETEREEEEAKDDTSISRNRERNRDKREIREKIRSLKKKYKTLAATSGIKNYNNNNNNNNNNPKERNRWKYRRDSVDLGRQKRLGIRKKETPQQF